MDFKPILDGKLKFHKSNNINTLKHINPESDLNQHYKRQNKSLLPVADRAR